MRIHYKHLLQFGKLYLKSNLYSKIEEDKREHYFQVRGFDSCFMYYTGEGIKQNFVQAEKWFRKAKENIWCVNGLNNTLNPNNELVNRLVL